MSVQKIQKFIVRPRVKNPATGKFLIPRVAVVFQLLSLCRKNEIVSAGETAQYGGAALDRYLVVCAGTYHELDLVDGKMRAYVFQKDDLRVLCFEVLFIQEGPVQAIVIRNGARRGSIVYDGKMIAQKSDDGAKQIQTEIVDRGLSPLGVIFVADEQGRLGEIHVQREFFISTVVRHSPPRRIEMFLMDGLERKA
jgi:hypothetical protein